MLTEVSTPQIPSTQGEPHTYKLIGHKSPVNSIRFSPDGKLLSGDKDGQIYLWDHTLPPDSMNIATMQHHKNEILDLGWFDSKTILSCSADTTAIVWDVDQNKQVKRLRHGNWSINTITSPSPAVASSYILTGGDDGMCNIWDIRFKDPAYTLATKYPITSIAMEPELRVVFTAGVDADIKAWDVRAGKVIYELQGHENTITSLALSDDSTLLVSNSCDNTIRSWDVRPKVSEDLSSKGRGVGVYIGAQHDKTQQLLRTRIVHGRWICSASSDGLAYLWDVISFRLLGKIPGHSGAVHDVDMCPNSNLLATAGIDTTILVGPLS